MNEKQRRRCEIITRLIANKISSSEASELLGRSSRQVRRIRQRYEALGLETLVHGNQGRPSPRRTKPALIEQLKELAGPTRRYHDFNVSHLAEPVTPRLEWQDERRSFFFPPPVGAGIHNRGIKGARPAHLSGHSH